MKLTEIINSDRLSLSFEVFPPKTGDAFESVKAATEKIAKLNPSYMSVTYGAGLCTANCRKFKTERCYAFSSFDLRFIYKS